MAQFEIRKKQYDELEGDQYDIVDTEHEDQVVVRYDNSDKAEEHLAHLNSDPETPFTGEQQGEQPEA